MIDTATVLDRIPFEVLQERWLERARRWNEQARRLDGDPAEAAEAMRLGSYALIASLVAKELGDVLADARLDEAERATTEAVLSMFDHKPRHLAAVPEREESA